MHTHTHIYIILLLINVTKLNLYLSPCSTVPKLVLQWCLKAHGKHQSTWMKAPHLWLQQCHRTPQSRTCWPEQEASQLHTHPLPHQTCTAWMHPFWNESCRCRTARSCHRSPQSWQECLWCSLSCLLLDGYLWFLWTISYACVFLQCTLIYIKHLIYSKVSMLAIL